MEVLRDNFDPKVFAAAVKDCDFIAFDLEFSGLSTNTKDKKHSLDTTEEIYRKMKDVCSTFFTFQVGICTFKWDDKEKKYLASPFNYYVFPSSKYAQASIIFQPGAIEFLNQHNMDWNKIFREGIHYWKRNKKEDLKNRITHEIKDKEENYRNYWNRLGTKSQEDKEELVQYLKDFLDRPCKEKDQINIPPNRNKVCWRSSLHAMRHLCKKYEGVKMKESSKDRSVTITKYPPKQENGDTTESSGSGEPVVETPEDKKAKEESKAVKTPSESTEATPQAATFPKEVKKVAEDIAEEAKEVTQKLEELKLSLEEAEEKEIEDNFVEQYGFTTIIDLLIEAKKPIVGHNMIYDVMLLYGQFIDDFPEKYEVFRQSWASCFPTVYDTKLLSSYCRPISRTWLKEAYDCCLENESLKGNLKFAYHPDFMMYDEEVQAHEAAYDAYMTGVIFATIAKYKEIVHEAKGRLDGLKEYQQAKSANPSGKEKEKEKEEAQKKIRDIEESVYKQTHEDCKNSPIVQGCLIDHENKVMAVSDKSRVLYFGENKNEIEKSMTLKVNEDRIIWVKLDHNHRDIGRIFSITQDLGDVAVQRDDENAYYVEFQTIYDKTMSMNDIINKFKKELGEDAQVTTFKSAEKYGVVN